VRIDMNKNSEEATAKGVPVIETTGQLVFVNMSNSASQKTSNSEDCDHQ
jgi:hypothetical protein